MCACTPSIRTPYCGSVNCRPPVWVSDSNDTEPVVTLSMSIRRARAAIQTCESLGYTFEGGEMWEPPLGEN